jgi:4-amino-4-deoxy-L-arabinose transferase-like glycosyltransferase
MTERLSMPLSTPLPFWKRDSALIGLFAAMLAGLHLLFNRQYGYFIDEFYYLACANHLSWGYVDHPPFSIALLAVSRAVFGDSLFGLRLLPALAGAGTVILTGLTVKEMGGGRTAQTIAFLGILINPLYLFMFNYYSMNSVDILLWTAAIYLVVRILNSGNISVAAGAGALASPEAVVNLGEPYSMASLLRRRPHWLWVLLGVVLGIGLLNKIDVLWLGAGLAAGIVVGPYRRLLRTRWPWIAAGIAALIFLPHILWQISHGWPTLEFMHNATVWKYSGISRLDFLKSLVLELHPLALPLWLAGLMSLLVFRLSKDFRVLGIIWLTVFLILLINGHSKGEYIAPAMPPLLAAGGVALERFFATRRRWMRIAAIGLLLCGGAVTAPYALPVLPVDSFIAYSKILGIQPGNAESKAMGPLPQHYADMFGWENMVATVARVYRTLTPDEQARCTIYGMHYGFAGAIDFYHEKYGLPGAVTGHNSYWLWGPGDRDGSVVIKTGGSPEDVAPYFESVTAADTIRCEYAMPYETNVPVYVCRGMKVPLREIWPKVKFYI